MASAARPVLRPLRKVGIHLGHIVLVTRVAVKLVHGRGGTLEGFPVDWTTALAMSCYRVNNQFAQHGEFDG